MIAGRKRLTEPSNRDQHILEALRDGHSQAKVARTYGISRQYVYEITTRWPKLAPKKRIKRHHG
jgi:uncharacterized protein (DUF433 family)